MIRFTLLQARLHIILALLGLAFVGFVMAVTAQDFSDAAKQCDLQASACHTIGDFLSDDLAQLYLILHAAILVTPAPIGIFWGAPLAAKEFSEGTHRLVWTQSVTRTRWIATKIATLGLLSMTIAALLSWMMEAWTHGVDDFSTFDGRGIVPVAHTAFAFALGVAVGLFVKRVVPAMVITLVVIITFGVGSPQVRPHLTTPVEHTTGVNGDTVQSGSVAGEFVRLVPSTLDSMDSLVLSRQFVDKDGKTSADVVFDAVNAGECAGLLPQTSRSTATHDDSAHGEEAFAAAHSRCLAFVDTGYDIRTTSQPPSRYWTLQWIESALYMALALALSALSIAFIRRRSS
jgi:hypothetical protein